MALITPGLQASRLVGASHCLGGPRRAAALQARPKPRGPVHSTTVFAVAEVRKVAEPARQPADAVTYKFPQNGRPVQPSELAEMLMEREEALRELLTPVPGVRAPKASVVAALRKEISGLRAQLRMEIAAATGTKVEPPRRELWDATRVEVVEEEEPPAPTKRRRKLKKKAAVAGSEAGAEVSGEAGAVAGAEGQGAEGEEEGEEEEDEEEEVDWEEASRVALEAINADDTLGAMPPQKVAQASASRVRDALRLVEERLAAGEASLGGAPATVLEAAWAAQPASSGAAAAAAALVPGGSNGAAPAAAPRRVTQRSSARRAVEVGVLPTSPDALQLEVLQIENARLQARLDNLLNREAQLKELARRRTLAAAAKEELRLAEEAAAKAAAAQQEQQQ